MSTLVKILVGVVLVAMLSACNKPTHTVRGFFVLTSENGIVGSVGDCWGTGGFADFKKGMNLTIRDETGKVVATTSLQAMETIRRRDSMKDVSAVLTNDDLLRGPGTQCYLWFEATVPQVEFYEFEAGHRGKITYARTDLAANNWNVTLTLGGRS